MGQRKKGTRKQSLYMVFIRYLLRFCVLTVILAAGTLVAYTVLVNTGIVRLPLMSRAGSRKRRMRYGREETKQRCSRTAVSSESMILTGTIYMARLRKMRDRKAGSGGRTEIPGRFTTSFTGVYRKTTGIW